MEQTWRWYGPNDPVSLDDVRQAGATGVVTALHHIPNGQVWPVEEIQQRQALLAEKGLTWSVVESIPVHEDIKTHSGDYQTWIANYQQSIRNLAACGIDTVCYNFMPVFDWTRTQLDKELPDGSNALVYYPEQIEKMDPLTGELSLPGWDASYTKETLKAVFDDYANITEEDLWNNLGYFLQEIIPVAEEADVKMAIHQDDPPWSIFGLPRIITCEANLDRMLALVDSKYNGLTLCTGSLGVSPKNDMVHLADKYSAMGRIHFVHARNVKILDGGFEEAAHYSPCGSLDMVGILRSLHQNGYDGYIRPDHGRMIWGETGRAGYGLYDRALGATYINGIWETLDKLSK